MFHPQFGIVLEMQTCRSEVSDLLAIAKAGVFTTDGSKGLLVSTEYLLCFIKLVKELLI
jgi:hypothetical protein